MIIGDEDQSIYQSFRHANPEGIRLFHETHANTTDYSLNECRRCPKKIVKIADRFIQNNNGRDAERHLLPRDVNAEGVIITVQWSDLDEESIGLAKYIKAKVDSGVNPGDILVLCPRRQLGYKMKDALAEIGVEAHSFFQEQLLDDLEAQKAFTLLMLYCNPQDGVAWRSVIGFGDNAWCAGYFQIKAYCEANDKKLWETLDLLLSKTINLKHTDKIIHNYKFFLDRLNQLKELKPDQVIKEIFPDDNSWAIPFREVIGEINEDIDCNDIRDLIRTNITQPELPAHPNFVRIMSLHKSKGLTAKIVIISGFIESLLPMKRAEWSVEEQGIYLEEQRRLVYVALTRPTKELIISSVYYLPRKEAHKMGAKVQSEGWGTTRSITSSFFSEMGPEFPNVKRGADWLKEHHLSI